MTEQQQWGLAYLTQLHNDGVAQRNANLVERNRFVPRDQPLMEPEEELSVEEYVAKRTVELANQGYQQLISFKEQEALRLFRAKTPEEQAALVAQLEIPDVLK